MFIMCSPRVRRTILWSFARMCSAGLGAGLARKGSIDLSKAAPEKEKEGSKLTLALALHA